MERFEMCRERKRDAAWRCILLFLTAAVIFAAGGLRKLRAAAQEAVYQDSTVAGEGFDASGKLCDGSRDTYARASAGAAVTVSREGGIGGIYIEFDRIPQGWRMKNPASGTEMLCGENAFLHEYVDVEENFGSTPDSLVLSFEEGTQIAEIYVFSPGELPEWVQVWQPPCKEADLLMIASHSDDEQLFFSGVLPYYAGERGLRVQVAYMVQHFETQGVKDHKRPHEQLDGLWTVGVRNYPVMSDFPDLYSESKNRQEALSQAESVYRAEGIGYEDFLGYIVECLRRFRPLVVVSHDLNGEYGHGTHVLSAAALTEAVDYAAREEKYPDSAEQYGVWTVEKLYLHLYEKNPVVMNFDVPLEHFGGKTAFEMSQEGFACHKSQHWTWFYRWMYGTEASPVKKAVDIKTYSPCRYGLYHTTVGLDAAGGDFFENVKTYAVREEEARLELEAALEAERVERKLREAVQAAEKAEEARQELEAAASRELAAAKRETEEARAEIGRLKKQLLAAVIVSCVLAALLTATVAGRELARRRRRHSRRRKIERD